MRFLGKYELLEQHTVGTVETFSAQPVGGSEQLVVHLFALPALTKASPSNRDLLDYLERICPPTLGSVVDGGQYDDGSQAYIVTKFPRDPDALGDWIEAYKAMPKAAQKPAAAPRRDAGRDAGRDASNHESLPQPWRPPADDGFSASPVPLERAAEKPVGDFTRAFQAFAAEKTPPAPPAARSPQVDPAPNRPVQARPVFDPDSFDPDSFDQDPYEPTPRRPGQGSVPVSLTDQFAGLGEGAQLPRSSPPPKPAAPPPSFPAPSASPFTSPFSAAEPVRPRKADSWAPLEPSPGLREPEAEPPMESPREPARAGEFTQFFRSPFAAPPADSPPLSVPDHMDRPAPARSDFTQLFGPASGGSLAPIAHEPLLEPPGQRERGNFTEIFGKARPASSQSVVPPWTPEKPVFPVPPAAVDPPERQDRGGEYFISNTNSLPISPGKRDADPVFRSSTPLGGPILGARQEEGATRVFKAPVQEPVAPPPPVEEGESQYTRIIKGPKREPAGASASSPEEAPAAGGLKLPPLPLPRVSVAKPSVGMPTLGPSGVAPPQVRMPSATVSAPPAPVMPHLQAPPPPSLGALPKVPHAPKLPPVKKPGNWKTYAPLIIILNLIFLAAVGLVLFFFLKQ